MLFQGVEVRLLDQFGIYATTTTNDQGLFEFTGVPTDQYFWIELRDGGNLTTPYCGLDSDDSGFCQRFVLTDGGNNSANGFWRLIACDVNQSGQVSAYDCYLIDKCWYYPDCDFPTFKFLPVEEYNDATAEYMQAGGGTYWPYFETVIYVTPGTDDLLDQDFYGIKMGDPVKTCDVTQFIFGKKPDSEFDFNIASNQQSSINYREIIAQKQNKAIKIYGINGVLLISEQPESFNIERYNLNSGIYIKETEDQSGKKTFEKVFIVNNN